MSVKKNANPLLGTQREKVGAVTFEKYLYQYHWALFRILQEHGNQKEYAVFIELHEDVVVANALDEERAAFEFNQVKTNKAAFTAKNLVKLKNGSSVLGKLISSSAAKPFKDQVSSLNLVSVKEYSLKLKSDLDLDDICVEDLHDETLNTLTSAIKTEIGVDQLPPNLHFIVSGLSSNQFQDLVIAEIAKVINNLFPGSNCNSIEIYRALYDEVTRKGIVTTDFTNWNSLLRNKALTSVTVSQVINQFTSVKDEGYIQGKLSTIIAELGLNSISGKALERSFTRYRQARLGNRSMLQLDTSKELQRLITDTINNGAQTMEDIMQAVNANISIDIAKQFSTSRDLDAAIICEFIMS